MDSQQAFHLGQQGLYMLLLVSAPILLAVLVVGLVVSVFQAATQINEATLSFVPKIVAAVAKTFICIADESKLVPVLGAFPLPVEVIPMARSHVARQLVKLGGDSVYRDGVVTDNGNIILDVFNLEISNPRELESQINAIVRAVCNGLFAACPADVLLLGTANGVKTLKA